MLTRAEAQAIARQLDGRGQRTAQAVCDRLHLHRGTIEAKSARELFALVGVRCCARAAWEALRQLAEIKPDVFEFGGRHKTCSIRLG